jgi:hypothetical protein
MGSTTYNVPLKTSHMSSTGKDKAEGCAAKLEDRQSLFSERTQFFRFVTRFFDLEDPVIAKQVDLVFVKFLTYFSAECVLVPPPPCTPGPTADIPSWWSTRRVLKRRLTQKRKRLG